MEKEQVYESITRTGVVAVIRGETKEEALRVARASVAGVIRTCNRYRMFCACGVMTVTEAVRAMEAGADMLKIFPADTLGMGFLKALHGPLPQAKLMPTGGVTVENTADWLRAGAVAVGTGGSLAKGDVSENARRFLAESAKVLKK